MAAKRWTTRVLASAVLLAVVILAGYRLQPPWWDAASDIREMSDALTDGTGYEGSDEYVPAGADPYELNKSLPRVSDDKGAPIRNEMLAWRQTDKHFKVHPAAPQDLVVRPFNYPAWKVVVNGKPTGTRTTDVTGLIVIPIAAGAKGEFSRLCLGERDELLYVIGGNRRMNTKDKRCAGHQDDGREILQRVIGQLAV